MRVLLVGKNSIVEPLGLLFLEASLRQIGATVDILLIGSLEGPARLSSMYDLIGFSTYTGYHKTIFRVSDNIRNDYKTKTIIGGPHATFFSDECLNHADYVVVGEGLKSMKDICRGDVGAGKVFTSDLVWGSMIPIPYRQTLYKNFRKFYANPIKNVMTSFGCPWDCFYCFNNSYHHLYKDRKVRYRSVDSVIEECLELKTYPLKLIFFQDDCFGFKLEWMEEFTEMYKRKIGVPFHCQIRPETVTIGFLRLLKEAGCHGVTMAIETYNEGVRARLLNRKGWSNDNIIQSCALVKEFGFKLRTEQMLGLPETGWDDEIKLLRMNCEIKPNIAWTSIFTPYLGTTLGDYCKKVGIYTGNNDDLDGSFFVDSKLKFSPERLKKTNQLQKIFATCAQIPDGSTLASNFIKSGKHDFGNWSEIMRRHLYDSDLYKVEGKT